MKEIPVLYTPTTFEYKPQVEIHEGRRYPSHESVTRAQVIKRALEASGIADIYPSSVNGMPWVRRVHSRNYLDFLARSPNVVRKYITDDEVTPGEERALYPSVFSYGRNSNKTEGEGEIGQYAFDMYTPLLENTYEVALASAGSAVEGAMLLKDDVRLVYVLTRPPGHHAERSAMGGYCYLNNAAIASEYLLKTGAKKIAIFDIDLHHGNGIQNYGYRRADVLYVSIHGNPAECYPFMSGNEEEHGKGPGEGTNINYPLPTGVDNEKYLEIAKQALKEIYRYSPDCLIIAAGFDTHKDDPFKFFRLTTDFYATLGKEISALGLPTLSLQEGGYNTDVLGDSVVAYLKGLLSV